MCSFIIIIIITLFAQENSVTETVNWAVGQDNMAAKTRARGPTLIFAREEKITYAQNYTMLDKTVELTLDITKI